MKGNMIVYKGLHQGQYRTGRHRGGEGTHPDGYLAGEHGLAGGRCHRLNQVVNAHFS